MATTTLSVTRVILGSRFYRAAVLALFCGGIGISATVPQLTLFLVNDLGASLPTAGLYYLTNLAAPVGGFLVGRWSDRTADRLPLYRVCAAVGALGWLAMALATQLWMPFVISTLALSISGASGAQLFAAARDELSRHPTGADHRVLSAIRMAYTAGWIVGPVVGSWLGGTLGMRPLLVFTAACSLAQILPLGRQRVARFVVTRTDRPAGRLRPMLPLLAFTTLCLLAMTGDPVKFAYLPIYMADQLGTPDTVRGAVISIQPFLELFLIPVAARLADRWGPLPVVIAGAVAGVGASTAYALSTGVAALFAGQLCMAGLFAALAGLGVATAQQLYPEGVGQASGIFLSALMLSGALGGVVGSVGTAALGLPAMFWLPAGLSAVSVVGLVLLHRAVGHRLRRPAVIPAEPVPATEP